MNINLSITRGTGKDFHLLAFLGRQTFIESHGSSAPKAVIEEYVAARFNEETCREELSHPDFHYYFIHCNDQPAGYSKMIFNCSHPNISAPNVTKLERLYLLQAFHHLHLGHRLLQFNKEKAREQGQAGLWLFVWTENHPAVRFFTREGFSKMGSYDFPLTAAHANPNHQLFLAL